MLFNVSAVLVFGLCLQSSGIPQHAQDPNAPGPWRMQVHPSRSSFRGLFVVDHAVIWASGSGGTVIRSTDGGEHWQSVSPTGAEQFDFRDVHAFDANHAIVMSAGPPPAARIYRTADAGQSWQLVYADKRPQAFFDAMSFWDAKRGIAFSDPIAGRLLLITTSDGGKTWKEIDRDQQPETTEGEAGFAASGTCLCTMDDLVWIGLGGGNQESADHARIFKSNDLGETWTSVATPMVAGEASGVFSIAFANRDHGVAVGGTYTEPDDQSSNICITDDGGIHWRRPTGRPPSGYRSCVAVRHQAGETIFICVGRNGCDFSKDWGNSWTRLDDETFHSVAFSKDGKTGIAVGRDGRIGVWK